MALRGLYGKPATLDVLCLLSLLDGYHESSSVWRAMQLGFIYNLPSKDVADLLHYSENAESSRYGARSNRRPDAHVSRDGLRIANELVTHVEGLMEAARRELPLRMLQLALEKSGISRLGDAFARAREREYLQHLNGFAERIKRYERSTHGPTLRGFLDELRVEMESGEGRRTRFDPDAGPGARKDQDRARLQRSRVQIRLRRLWSTRAIPESLAVRAYSVARRTHSGSVYRKATRISRKSGALFMWHSRGRKTGYISPASHYGGNAPKTFAVFSTKRGLEVPDISGIVRRRETPDDTAFGRRSRF